MPINNPTLKQALMDCDPSSAADLSDLYTQFNNSEHFTHQLVTWLPDKTLQRAASWLLKKQLETGNPITLHEIAQLFDALPQLEHWEAKLHILQCLPKLSISVAQKKAIETFLHTCLVAPNKFVRAWAYSGFYTLATQHAEYEETVQQYFDMALRDEAASVKARIRQILKTAKPFGK